MRVGTAAVLIFGLVLRGVLAGEIIRWDTESLTEVQAGGNYGRIIEVAPGKLICAYSRGGGIEIRRSRDAGRTWEEPIRVADWKDGALTNAELLRLGNGTLWVLMNRRPGDEARRRGVPYSIAFAQSRDGGATWSEPRTLYEAGPEFSNGCWEPAGLQLPDGEIQISFANEGPYRDSDEQEITLLRSRDGGRTWSGPEKISFRAGHRDGMPVPLLLKDRSGIAVAIEDNGLHGGFKPVIVFTTAADNWKSGPVGGSSARRWSALARPLEADTYAGAPYLRQLRDGQTVLSFQRKKAGESAERIAVAVGNPKAKRFGTLTFPFPETPGRPQQWASLCPLSDGSVLVIADATVNGRRGLWTVKGRPAPE